VADSKPNPKLILLAMLSVALMSLVPVIVKITQANEITIAIVRLLIAATGIAILAKSKKQSVFNKSNLKWLLLLGLMFSGHWYTYFKSLKMSTVSLGAIGVSTFGVHLLILNWFFFKEALKLSDFIAVFVALSGVYLVLPDSNFQPEHFIGFMYGLFSGFLYACLPIINRKASHLTTSQKAFGQFGFGLLFFAPFFPLGNWQLSSQDWLGLLVLGIVATLIAHTLWIKVSTELPSSITATVYYFYVPLAMTFGYFIFDEELTWQKVTGAGLIIFANITVVWLHNKAAKR
jgi:drug/metabolite transporter (DMT)-like permease